MLLFALISSRKREDSCGVCKRYIGGKEVLKTGLCGDVGSCRIGWIWPKGCCRRWAGWSIVILLLRRFWGWKRDFEAMKRPWRTFDKHCWQGRWEVCEELLYLSRAAVQSDLNSLKEMQSSVPVSEETFGRVKAGDWQERSSAEKDQEVLVSTSKSWASSMSWKLRPAATWLALIGTYPEDGAGTVLTQLHLGYGTTRKYFDEALWVLAENHQDV